MSTAGFDYLRQGEGFTLKEGDSVYILHATLDWHLVPEVQRFDRSEVRLVDDWATQLAGNYVVVRAGWVQVNSPSRFDRRHCETQWLVRAMKICTDRLLCEPETAFLCGTLPKDAALIEFYQSGTVGTRLSTLIAIGMTKPMQLVELEDDTRVRELKVGGPYYDVASFPYIPLKGD
jgi:hypothetical protein